MARFDSRKSTTRSPFAFLIHASRMFHSFGTVQSKTAVPLATSWISSGIGRASARRVRRRPSPVMLRQNG